MWKNFLHSMGLLALALATAFFSTAASQAGNLPATVVSALLSLILAGWVAIRFVPRLASGVDWTRLPGAAHYRITREGLAFLGALFVVLAAAINTSNNLLYMVLSALLGILVLSAILSAINFRALEMELLLPARAFAGETVPFSMRIRNRRRLFPAFSLQAQPPGDRLFFSLIQPRESFLHPGEAKFERRGRYSFDRLGAASRFPFGFFIKTRTYPIDAECLCYPSIIPEDQLNISARDILGDQSRQERGTGSDLYTIRDYLPSDSARHVHWKATAKTNMLKTREYAADESQNVVVVLDRYGQPGDEDFFEALVSRAASIAFHLIRRGARVTLIADDWKSPADNTEASLDPILNYLALVEMSPDAPPPSNDWPTGAVILSLRGGQV